MGAGRPARAPWGAVKQRPKIRARKAKSLFGFIHHLFVGTSRVNFPLDECVRGRMFICRLPAAPLKRATRSPHRHTPNCQMRVGIRGAAHFCRSSTRAVSRFKLCLSFWPGPLDAGAACVLYAARKNLLHCWGQSITASRRLLVLRQRSCKEIENSVPRG